MVSNTKIYDKFEYWTVADCACKFCVNHVKKQPCSLEVCSIADIREELPGVIKKFNLLV